MLRTGASKGQCDMSERALTENEIVSADPVVEAIAKTIHKWMTEGDMVLSEVGVRDPELEKLPVHLGYIYRLTGDWKGWNHVSNVKPVEVHEENRRVDALEDRAFQLLNIVLESQKRRMIDKLEGDELDASAESVVAEIITGISS